MTPYQEQIYLLLEEARTEGGSFSGEECDLVEWMFDNGWGIVLPTGHSGTSSQWKPCSHCRGLIEPGTAHSPFNGNQMFACQIRPLVPDNQES